MNNNIVLQRNNVDIIHCFIWPLFQVTTRTEQQTLRLYQ